MSMRVSSNGVSRQGKRGGNVARLNAVSKAYASAVRQASRQYDGHNAIGPEGLAVIMWARLKVQGPVLTDDNKHNALIAEASSPALPKF